MIDLLGMRLEQAENILVSKGILWRINETCPPKEICGFNRIVKQEVQDGNYILTVCMIPDLFAQAE